jgi:formate dehydrogenase (coenzyme F420) beta subunit
LLSKPEELAQVDPFAPVLPLNGARLANRLDREHLGRPLGAVLRSCEIRALAAPQNWLLIGVDCIGSYPVDEYAWRVDKAGTPEELTSQTLKNARQGGIALHRFRSACQMCPEPESPQSDLSIHLLGLPVRESLLVKAHDDRIAGELDLERLTSGPAPAWLVEQHEEMVARVRERRQRKQRRIYAELPPDLPGDIEELLAHLKTCQSCRECLDACPNFHGQWDPAGVMDDAALERCRLGWFAA